MKLLACPCGSHVPIMLWRKRSASNFYVMRCPTCSRQSDVATTDFEKLDMLWNDTVRMANRRGGRP
jgi:hypothetical protein